MRQNLLINMSIRFTKYLIIVEKYYVKQAIPTKWKRKRKSFTKRNKIKIFFFKGVKNKFSAF